MRILSIIFVIALFTSCKEPLPVYFDKPSGQLTDTFPSRMQGNYFIADNVITAGIKSFEEKYSIQNGKIVLTEKDEIDLVADSVLKFNAKSDTSKAEKINDTLQKQTEISQAENAYNKYTHFNALSILDVFGQMDKNKKMVFGFVKIDKKSISIVSCDSLANNHEMELYRLSDKVTLSYYSDNYYLNVRTPFGWEVMQIEVWNKGQFLNFIPFISTKYDENAPDVKTFIKSTAIAYPKLKPIYNGEHLIIGMKAKMNPELLKEKFKEFDSGFELLKAEGR